jgi:hypothetical protein
LRRIDDLCTSPVLKEVLRDFFIILYPFFYACIYSAAGTYITADEIALAIRQIGRASGAARMESEGRLLEQLQSTRGTWYGIWDHWEVLRQTWTSIATGARGRPPTVPAYLVRHIEELEAALAGKIAY